MLIKDGKKKNTKPKFFDNDKKIFAYLKKHAHNHRTLKQARKKDKKFSLINQEMCDRQDSDFKRKVYEYFGGKQGERLCLYFRDTDEAFEYIKNNAEKHENLHQASAVDKRFVSIQNLIRVKKLDKDKVYSYFGGPKNVRGTDELCIYFKTVQDVVDYLTIHSEKYNSFAEAKRFDKKMIAIANKMTRCPDELDPDLVRSFFTFGGIKWNRHEREVKVMYEFREVLRKLRCVKELLFEHEIEGRNRVDIIVTVKGKKVLIEGKHDESVWTTKQLAEQLERYIKIGKDKYKNTYLTTLICSPNGRYGMSFKEVIAYLKSIK